MVELISGSEAFETALQTNKLVIVDFFAEWCGPCKMVSPILESFAANYAKQVEESAPAAATEEEVSPQKNKIKFIKVNVDLDNEIATKSNVTAMPTFMIFTDGELTKTIVGANTPLLKGAIDTAFEGIA